MKWEKFPGYIMSGPYHIFSSRIRGTVIYTASVRGQVLGLIRDIPIDDIEAKKKALEELRALCEEHESAIP